MNLTITGQKRDGYLFIESKGIVENVDELMAHSRMIYEEIAKHDFKKILVYEPETSLPLDLIPHFDLVKSYIEQYPAHIRELTIAVVVASWEAVCQSRGLQYYVFTSLEEAVNCLIEE